MRQQTGLVRRGGVWWFRRRIPQDLLPHYAPKKEQIFSLRTSDKDAAQRLARLRAVELDQEYARVRAATEKANRGLSAEDVQRLAALYVTWRLDEDERIRRSGLDDEQFRESAEQLDADIAVVREVVARGKAHTSVTAMLDAFLDEQGLVVRPESDSYKRLAYEIAKADVRAMELMKARDRGEPVDTPKAPDVTALKAPLPTAREREAFGKFSLDDLCGYWKKQKKPASKTVIEADSVIRRFKQAAGDIPPAKVERRHVIALRDSLVEQGKAPGTVKKLLGLLSGMFQVAVEDDARFGVETNPVRDVKVRGAVGEAKTRKPFTVDDRTPSLRRRCTPKGSALKAAPQKRRTGFRSLACIPAPSGHRGGT